MPFNGSGVFQRVRNWVADATAGIKIRADYHDAEDDGFATGLSNTITKDGQTVITQNIPFNSKRITGLADPINAQDASTKAYSDTKIPIAGGAPMTGDLNITKDGPQLILNSTGTGASNIAGQKNGKARWYLRLGNDEAESGANAGSALDILRFADDGTTYLGQPLRIDRATGLGTVTGDPTAALGIATKQYVDTRDAAVVADRVLRAGDTMTGNLTTAASAAIGSPGGVNSIEVRGATANSAAISFHIPGVFATNFGVGNDGNFYMGGWSHGVAGNYKFWTTRDFAALPVAPTLPANIITGVKLVKAGDYAHTAVGVTEPYAGAVATGGSPTVSGAYYYSRYRWLQVFANGGWSTVGIEG